MARKKRIVLIESSNGHRKLLSFNLEIYLGVDVIFKNNADMLINLLKRDSDIQLIISEESVGSEQTILKIYYYITSANLNIPIILSGNCKKLMGKIEMYERKDWRKIIKKSANILGVTAKDMAKKEYEKYYPISTDMLLVMTRAPVDIFVSEGSHKFNVLFPAGKEIEQKAVRKHFLDLENTSLFCPRNDSGLPTVFLNRYLISLPKKIYQWNIESKRQVWLLRGPMR